MRACLVQRNVNGESDIKCIISAQTSNADMRQKAWIWNVKHDIKGDLLWSRLLAAFLNTHCKTWDFFLVLLGMPAFSSAVHTLHYGGCQSGCRNKPERSNSGNQKDKEEEQKREAECLSASSPTSGVVIREQQTTMSIDPVSDGSGTRGQENDRNMLFCFLSLKKSRWRRAMNC